MAFDLDQWLEGKRPQATTCPIANDPDVIEAHAQAQAALDVAQRVVEDNPSPATRAALAEAEDVLEEAAAAAEAATTVFHYEGLNAPEWDALLDDHPPTKEQINKERRAGRSAPQWNDETFPAALVAACCVDPKLSTEDAQRILDSKKLNGAEQAALFVAAFDACRKRRIPQLGKGSGRTLS